MDDARIDYQSFACIERYMMSYIYDCAMVDGVLGIALLRTSRRRYESIEQQKKLIRNTQ